MPPLLYFVISWTHATLDPETKMGEEASGLSLLFECFALQQYKSLVASESLRWSRIPSSYVFSLTYYILVD